MKNQVAVVRSQAEFYAEVMHRARCTLGLRGVKNPNKVKLNVTALNKHSHRSNVVLTDDEMEVISRQVVEDTMDCL